MWLMDDLCCFRIQVMSFMDPSYHHHVTSVSVFLFFAFVFIKISAANTFARSLPTLAGALNLFTFSYRSLYSLRNICGPNRKWDRYDYDVCTIQLIYICIYFCIYFNWHHGIELKTRVESLSEMVFNEYAALGFIVWRFQE